MNPEVTPATLPVSILVIESGGYSLPWLKREGSGQLSAGQVSPDMMVISQLAGEPPHVFATRVMRRMARLERATVVSRAVLVCGSRSDELSLAARARVSQALLASLQVAPFAKLTLAAPQAASDQLRHQLLAIAGTMLEQVPGVGISVQLGDGGSTRRGALTETAEIARKVA